MPARHWGAQARKQMLRWRAPPTYLASSSDSDVPQDPLAGCRDGVRAKKTGDERNNAWVVQAQQCDTDTQVEYGGVIK